MEIVLKINKNFLIMGKPNPNAKHKTTLMIGDYFKEFDPHGGNTCPLSYATAPPTNVGKGATFQKILC